MRIIARGGTEGSAFIVQVLYIPVHNSNQRPEEVGTHHVRGHVL